MTLLSSVIPAGCSPAGRWRRCATITATARRVSGENLGERIALHGPADELKELADTFDGMLGRLDAAFASQRHFVAYASHELRTPLAIMRTEVDVALADPDATVEDLRSMGEALRDMVDRCERLIASLLLLARWRRRSGATSPPTSPCSPATASPTCTPPPAMRGSTIDSELQPALTTATRACSSA